MLPRPARNLLLTFAALSLVGLAAGCASRCGSRSAGCCSPVPGCAAAPRASAATAPSPLGSGARMGAVGLRATLPIKPPGDWVPIRQSADVPNATADALPERAAVGLIGPAQVGVAEEHPPEWWTWMGDGVRHLWRIGEEWRSPNVRPGTGTNNQVVQKAERSQRSIPLPITALQQADPGSLAASLMFPQRTARLPAGLVRRSDGIAANQGRDLSAPSRPAGEPVSETPSQPVLSWPPPGSGPALEPLELEEWPRRKTLEQDHGGS